MQRINRIQLQSDIIQKNKANINFPGVHNNIKAAAVYEFPGHQDIFNTIEKARVDAIKQLNSVQIKTNQSPRQSFDCNKKHSKNTGDDEVYISEDELKNTCHCGAENDDDLLDHEEEV